MGLGCEAFLFEGFEALLDLLFFGRDLLDISECLAMLGLDLSLLFFGFVVLCFECFELLFECSEFLSEGLLGFALCFDLLL